MPVYVRRYGPSEWGLQSPRYFPPLLDAAKKVPGMRWDPAARAWVGYIDAVHTTSKLLIEAGVELKGEKIPSPDEPVAVSMPIATKDLRDYQVRGVEFVVGHAESGCILADDMGLGKTAQALRAARCIRSRATVVVCPGFVKEVWKKEAAKWWGTTSTGSGPNVEILSGVKNIRDLKGLDRDTIFIVNYDILHAWAERLAQVVDMVIFDEGHYLMGASSRRSKAARLVARAAKWKLVLTGTPMTSRPKDLWNVIDTVSEGRFGSGPFPFYLRYCDAHREQVTREKTVWKWDGVSNAEELHDRLRFFMLRRVKSEVSLELPARQRQILEVTVPKGKCVDPAKALDNNAALRRALDLAADGKIPEVIALAQSHLAEGHKVVVFCHRRAVAEVIYASLHDDGQWAAALIHGGIEQKKRDSLIEAQPDAIVCTLDSTAVGIDFSFADVGIFAELDYVPSKLAQGESRLHRFGQARNVLIQYVIAEGTVDELIRDVVIKKLDTFERVVGKLDDGLREDLDEDFDKRGAEALKKFWESL
jgi:SWI/SNF-related matrix-associated actin-dependent regulator 1 of chromatin subfamily A